MRPQTESWIAIAEIDYETAILAAGASRPILESVCFHAQQCVEKYLKAVLEDHECPVPRTHSLGALLELVLPYVPDLIRDRDGLLVLGSYAVVFRYPHDPIDPDELRGLADDALSLMIRTRRRIRRALEDETDSP